jgi:hypothetical protein
MTGNAPPLATLVTFSDFKLIKTRAVAQFIFEVPIEKADDVLADLGGLPVGAAERWCGIARVQHVAVSGPQPGVATPPRAIESDPRDRGKLLPRRKWEDLTPAQQAGIRCGEREFDEFLITKFVDYAPSEDAADVVRKYCGVQSRSLIRPGTQAEQRWNLLESSYQAWLAERQYADNVR